MIGKGNHSRAEHGYPRSPSGARAKVEYGLTCMDANGGKDEVPDRGTSAKDAYRPGIVGYSCSRRVQSAAEELPFSAVSAGLRGVWYRRAMA